MLSFEKYFLASQSTVKAAKVIVQNIVKLTFSFFLSTLLSALLNGIGTSACAQEYPGSDLGAPNYQQGGAYEVDDKPLIYEPEGSTKTYRARDTTYTRPAPAAKKAANPSSKTNGNGKPKEEDPLSFNFLYYIIQKFKSTDILEP